MKYFSYICDTTRLAPISVSCGFGDEDIKWWILLTLRIPKYKARVYTFYLGK